MGKPVTIHYKKKKYNTTGCGENSWDVKHTSDKKRVTCYSCSKYLKRRAFNRRVRRLVRIELDKRGIE